MSTFTEEGLEETLRLIAKRYPGSVGQDYDRNPPRISTSSYELDRATGGGIPLGRFSMLWGGWSSAKSLTCWNVIRNAQQMGLGPCVYYNAEKQYHPEFVERLGVSVDPKDLIVIEGTIVEELGTKLEALLAAARVHVVDSLYSAVSIDELNTPLENNPAMALKARAWGRVLDKAMSRLQPENSVILVNQARQLFNYGGGEHPPGGNLIEHNSSLTIHFRKGKWLFKDKDGILDEEGTNSKTLSGQTEAQGYSVQCKVTKTRVCKPHRTATMYVDYDLGPNIDTDSELVKAAKFFNVAEQTSVGRWVLPDGTKIHGKKQLREAIVNDPEFRDAIIARIKADY